jgi:hypothetical protein
MEGQQERQQHRGPKSDMTTGVPCTNQVTPINANEDSKNGERDRGTKDDEDGNPTPKSQSRWNCFDDMSDNEVRQEQTIEPSPRRRDYPKQISRHSEDADSIVDKIMRSFDAPSGADDDDHIERMYGGGLRTKESIEAELELHYGRSSGENECRDPSPPPDPPMAEKKVNFNSFCHADESNNPYLFRAEFPKSPSRSVSEKMQEMIVKFNHFG